MHGFEVRSNESACRKSGRLGLEQVFGCNSPFSIYHVIFLCKMHQEDWDVDQIFQEMDDHARSSQEEYISMDGGVMWVD